MAVMPAGARCSLASPTVVNGVLCQCGGVSRSPSSPASFSSSGHSEAASRFLAEHERRLYSLFVQLDVNRDGALCVHDLAVGLERLGLHRSERDLWVSWLPPSRGGSTRALEHACRRLKTLLDPGLTASSRSLFLCGFFLYVCLFSPFELSWLADCLRGKSSAYVRSV